MWEGHWTPKEFNFLSDIHQFKIALNDKEREIITKSLATISQIETKVKLWWSRLGDALPHPSIIDMGLVMAQIEVIHNKAYEKLLDVLQLQGAFEDCLKLDIIDRREKYLTKYIKNVYKNGHKQFLYSVILFTLFVEYVSLFGQFYVILHFNRFKNVLKDTAQQVQYTKNEELLHSLAGIKIINTIREECPELFDEDLEERIVAEAKEAFKAEAAIIDWILGDYEDEKLTPNILKEYIKNRINWSMEEIGFSSVFDIDEALLEESQWMEEEVYGNNKIDFFHKRAVEYSVNSQSYDEDALF